MLLAATAAPGARGWDAGAETVVLETESGPHSYTVEVAATDGERARGLMFRRTLPEASGMLFLYDEPQRIGMWMQNTYIPLDMVFISPDGRVDRIETNTEPFSTDIITSSGEVVAVLELNAGQAAKIGLKPGDQVIHPAFGDEPAKP